MIIIAQIDYVDKSVDLGLEPKAAGLLAQTYPLSNDKISFYFFIQGAGVHFLDGKDIEEKEEDDVNDVSCN